MPPPKPVIPYDRKAALRYAHKWAFGRNPAYYDYEELGGTVPTSPRNVCMRAQAL